MSNMRLSTSNTTVYLIVICVSLYGLSEAKERTNSADYLARERRHNELEFKSSLNQNGSPTISMTVNRRMTREDEHDNKIETDEAGKQGIQDDYRLSIGEPYKTMVQTSLRFALAQTPITKHLNIETAINLVNDVSYALSRPKILLKTLKIVAISIATLLATIFFFPSAHKFAESAWQDPMDAFNLDRYLTNGLQERSVLAALGSKTDETLSRVGLHNNSCRQRSICHLGEIIKCTFPQTTEAVTKFASDNFSGTSARENVYARAFISGFVDGNCTGVGGDGTGLNEGQNCLGNFFKSVLNGVENSRSQSRSKRK